MPTRVSSIASIYDGGRQYIVLGSYSGRQDAPAVHWYAHVAYNGYECDLVRVEVLRARKQDDHLWVGDSLPAQPSLTFITVSFLDIPCIVSSVLNTNIRLYFMELDITTNIKKYIPGCCGGAARR
eukprot:g82451.t1